MRRFELAATLVQVVGGFLLLVAAGVWVPWPAVARALGFVPWPAWLAVAGLLLVGVTRSWLGARRRGNIGGSWWLTIVLIVLPVVALTTVALVVLLTQLDTSDATVRVDVIRTALSVGAGAAGVAALVLAGRRQWSTEHDATERRITELYTKAADQLGSDKAPVRLAGLYALERLGQSNPRLRQTIVNVICAYLRMPYTPPVEGTPRPLGRRPPRPRVEPTTQDEARQEREVRLTAQRLLATHLNRVNRSTFWPDIHLDLAGATLIDFALLTCSVRSAMFSNARFTGYAIFIGSRFNREAIFDAARFNGRAHFDDAEFKDVASFDEVQFGDRTTFHRSKFAEPASFTGAGFGGNTSFAGVQFDSIVWFDRVQFDADADFGDARFRGVSPMWSEARFAGPVTFENARFPGEARLHDAWVRLSNSHRYTWPPGWVLRRPSPGESETLDGETGLWWRLEHHEDRPLSPDGVV